MLLRWRSRLKSKPRSLRTAIERWSLSGHEAPLVESQRMAEATPVAVDWLTAVAGVPVDGARA
ncbi:hypothetical protein P3T17_005628 [Paraburkholderia sp. GAS82]